MLRTSLQHITNGVNNNNNGFVIIVIIARHTSQHRHMTIHQSLSLHYQSPMLAQGRATGVQSYATTHNCTTQAHLQNERMKNCSNVISQQQYNRWYTNHRLKATHPVTMCHQRQIILTASWNRQPDMHDEVTTTHTWWQTDTDTHNSAQVKPQSLLDS